MANEGKRIRAALEGIDRVKLYPLSDAVSMLRFLLSADVFGPINAVAPEAVTNEEFTETLGRIVRRPTMLPVPVLR